MTDGQQYGVVSWPWKLMVRPAENLVELYDLVTDMAEKHDLSAGDGERVRTLKALYRSVPPPVIDRTPEGRKKREEAARSQLHH
jgi:hypothetical protein